MHEVSLPEANHNTDVPVHNESLTVLVDEAILDAVISQSILNRGDVVAREIMTLEKSKLRLTLCSLSMNCA